MIPDLPPPCPPSLPPSPSLCVEMGFYADISWESRCNIEINVWAQFFKTLLFLEVPYRPQVKGMPGKGQSPPPPKIFGRNRSKTFSFKRHWITTRPPPPNFQTFLRPCALLFGFKFEGMQHCILYVQKAHKLFNKENVQVLFHKRYWHLWTFFLNRLKL